MKYQSIGNTIRDLERRKRLGDRIIIASIIAGILIGCVALHFLYVSGQGPRREVLKVACMQRLLIEREQLNIDLGARISLMESPNILMPYVRLSQENELGAQMYLFFVGNIRQCSALRPSEFETAELKRKAAGSPADVTSVGQLIVEALLACGLGFERDQVIANIILKSLRGSTERGFGVACERCALGKLDCDACASGVGGVAKELYSDPNTTR